jgi:hypothetical protein
MFFGHVEPRNISKLTFLDPNPRNISDLTFLGPKPRSISELTFLGPKPRNIRFFFAYFACPLAREPPKPDM